MQDSTTAAFQAIKPHFPEQEQLKCPRCDSTNTKFCYYNNYNLSQPRHFCKNCRRYWTKGGSLRNIPVGGGSRKNTKRSSSQKRANRDPNPESTRTNRRPPESASPTSTPAAGGAAETSQLMSYENSGLGQEPVLIYGSEGDPNPERKVVGEGGGFTFGSLLTSNSQMGSIFDRLNSNGSGLKMVPIGGVIEDLNSVSHSGSGPQPRLDVQGGHKTSGGGGNSERYMEDGDWGNSHGWPDLAIYTPGSSHQ